MKKHFTTFVMVAVAGILAPVAFVGCATSNDRDSHKRTAGQYIDDKVLAQKVRSAIGDSDVYKFPDVKVASFKGTVQLSGFVDTQEQRAKAEEIARNVNGVASVENNIVMKGETERVRGTINNNNYPNNNTAPPPPRTNP
jgi:hyperosmotically inducible protein